MLSSQQCAVGKDVCTVSNSALVTMTGITWMDGISAGAYRLADRHTDRGS